MASHQEQILESARRNNTELLLQLKSESNNIVPLINNTFELITNNSSLHLACSLGNWEWLDIVLDIPLIEIDPLNHDLSTPLHLATIFSNSDPTFGYFIIDNLLDAGSDPRLKNKSGYKPADLVINNDKLVHLLESAEYAISMEPSHQDQLAQLDQPDSDGPSDDEHDKV